MLREQPKAGKVFQVQSAEIAAPTARLALPASKKTPATSSPARTVDLNASDDVAQAVMETLGRLYGIESCDRWNSLNDAMRYGILRAAFYGDREMLRAYPTRRAPPTPPPSATPTPPSATPTPPSATTPPPSIHGPTTPEEFAAFRSRIPADAHALADSITAFCGGITRSGLGRSIVTQLNALGIPCGAFLGASMTQRYLWLDRLIRSGTLHLTYGSTNLTQLVMDACHAGGSAAELVEMYRQRVQHVLSGDCAAWNRLDGVQQMRAINAAFPELSFSDGMQTFGESMKLNRLSLLKYDQCNPHPRVGLSEWLSVADIQRNDADLASDIASLPPGTHVEEPDYGVPLTAQERSELQWVVPGPYMPSSGPDVTDPLQGFVGDCYLIAALSSIAWVRPEFLARMISVDPTNPDLRRLSIGTSDTGGRQTVTFSERVPTLVLRDYLYMFAKTNRYEASWPAVIEKAYAKWRTGAPHDFPDIRRNDALDRDNGAGRQHQFTVFASVENAVQDLLCSEEAFWYLTWFRSASAVWDVLQEYCHPDGKAAYPMIAGSYSLGDTASDNGVRGTDGIVRSHAYSILGIGIERSINRKFVVLRNPWGYFVPPTELPFRIRLTERWHGMSLNDSHGERGVFAIDANAFKDKFGAIYGAV